MECRNIRRNLPALLDGDLRPEPARAVRLHLDACPGCAAELLDLQEFLRTSDEALVYQGAPLRFDALRARMAAIEPIDQVVRYQLPKLRIPGAVPRFAVAMLLLAVLAGVPYAFRNTRQVYTAVRTPFEQQEATLLAALENDRFPGESDPAAARGDDLA